MVSEKNGSHSSGTDLKPDISLDELKKMYARAASQRFDETPRYPNSETSGVMPMNIKGRFQYERERLGPDFNDKERQWRIKWIQDQQLHPSEPFEVKQLYKEYHNPLRRFYRYPLDLFQNKLSQYVSPSRARITRIVIGRGILGYLVFLNVWYYLKYNKANWEKERGVRLIVQREPVYPGDPRYPRSNPRTESWQHFDRGFHDRKALLNN